MARSSGEQAARTTQPDPALSNGGRVRASGHPLQGSRTGERFDVRADSAEHVVGHPLGVLDQLRRVLELDSMQRELLLVKQLNAAIASADHVQIEVDHRHRGLRSSGARHDVDVQLDVSERWKPSEPAIVRRHHHQAAAGAMEEDLFASVDRRPDAKLEPETVLILAEDPPGVPVVRGLRPLPPLDPDLPHSTTLAEDIPRRYVLRWLAVGPDLVL
jgi:hypothetical protein